MKKISVKTLCLLCIITIGLVVLGVRSTYAMFISTIEINDPIIINTTLNTENNVIRMLKFSALADCINIVTLNVDNTEDISVNYAVWYSTNSSNVEIGTYFGNADSSGSVGNIEGNSSKKVYVQIKNNSSSNASVTFGIASSYNDVTLNDDMTLVPNNSVSTSSGLAKKITDLYSDGVKSDVSSNNITYKYVTSSNLMNDRRGSLEIGFNSGNIRYYGATPDNYIYFNCSDYSNQSSSTCETWRIVGVFDNKVKIIRGSQIGNLSWDQDKNVDSSLTTYDNNWNTASLMQLLNDKYYNGNTSGNITYYSGSDGSTSTSVDMGSIGIKNNTTRNMIDNSTWYLGGWFSALIFSSQMYQYERSSNIYTDRELTWDGKVALLYPSDYGYAADFSECNKTLYNYNTSNCISNNWMYNIVTNNGNNVGWLLTPISNDGVSAWHVNNQGFLRDLHSTYLDSGAVPTLYLKANVDISDGNGSSSAPYKLKIS